MVKLTKKAQAEADAWAARVAAENLTAGMTVLVKRVVTDSRDYITAEWWETATLREVRTFDAVAVFADGTTSSTGLGIRTGPVLTEEELPVGTRVLVTRRGNLYATVDGPLSRDNTVEGRGRLTAPLTFGKGSHGLNYVEDLTLAPATTEGK